MYRASDSTGLRWDLTRWVSNLFPGDCPHLSRNTLKGVQNACSGNNWRENKDDISYMMVKVWR